MTDQQLLRAIVRDNSDKAFAEWVLRHQHMVFSTSYRRLDQSQLAEDAVQHSFLRLILKPSFLLSHPCRGG